MIRVEGTSGGPSTSGRRGVLILGGTAEGRDLAADLTASGVAVVSSLAGRVSTPRLPPGEVRVGGFGGSEGLAEYLREQRFAAVVDATHPFAAQITANAVRACSRAETPLLVLRRPPWTARTGDRWTSVPDLATAATALTGYGSDAAVLLTIGRQSVAAFSAAGQRFWLRAIHPPDGPLPARLELILDRGPFLVDAEIALLQSLSIELMVTKNSGGAMTSAKLTAARRLGVPVIIVERPVLPPEARVTGDTPTALRWARRHSCAP